MNKQTGPVYPNYREALRAAFGSSADRIPGVDPQCGTLTDVPVYGLRVLLGDEGRTFVVCGNGEVFASMATAEPACRITFFLVRDDADGHAWERRRPELNAKPSHGWTEAEMREYHTPRPSARYSIVASI